MFFIHNFFYVYFIQILKHEIKNIFYYFKKKIHNSTLNFDKN